MFLSFKIDKYFFGKSYPTTETIELSILKTEDEIPIYIPEPPNILFTLPKGVFMESKATVPTINNLFIF